MATHERAHRFRVLAEQITDDDSHAAVHKLRDPDPGNAIPWRLRKHRWRYRLGFVAFVAALCALVLTTPKSPLINADGSVDWDLMNGGIVLLLCEAVAYWAVAHSDPGYLDSETALRIGEEQALHRDEERGAPASRASNAENRPRRVMVSTQRSLGGSAEGLDALEQGPLAEANAAEEEHGMDQPPGDVDEDDEEPDDEGDAALSGLAPEQLPVRAKFCRKSRRVVSTFDHHCLVLNTTIGERNRARFWLLLLTSTAGLAWLLAVAHSSIHDAPASDWLIVNGHALVAALAVWPFMLGVGGLWALHTFFMLANMTMYEFLRADKVRYLTNTREFDLPFSNGLLGNVRFFFASDALCHGLVARLTGTRAPWRPHAWPHPGPIERDSTDIINHCWENKYWSCC